MDLGKRTLRGLVCSIGFKDGGERMTDYNTLMVK